MTTPPSLLHSPPALRRLHAGEAPYPGELRIDDVPTLWVDVAEVPEQVWRASPESHVLAPADIARTADGHAALFPHCSHRLVTFVEAAPLTAGVSVTIAVSMVRAAAEAHRCDIEFGSWWVATGGRPVLAASGSARWQQEAAELFALLEVGSGGALAAALRRASALVAAPRLLPREAEATEDALFAVAEPAPLGDPSPTELGPRRADTLRRAAHGNQIDVAESWFARFSDHDIAARVAQSARAILAAPAAWGRAVKSRSAPSRPARTRRSRAPLFVAAAVAAVVIVVGLAWPEPEAPATPARAAEPSAAESATGDSQEESAAADSADGSPTGDDAESNVAVRVLDALSDCALAATAGCEHLMEEAAAPLPTGAVSAARGKRQVSLLDEYGGVSVFRVDATGHPSQALVLVAVDDRWLVRDVYDLADQP